MERAEQTAVVVGGGIGGVAAALGLIRIGWSVTVLERSPEPADRGSGITLFPNALRALDAIGSGDPVRAVGAPLPAGSGLRTPTGRVLVDGAEVPPVLDVLAYHRTDLHRALREQLPPGMLRTGVEVTQVRDDGVTTGSGTISADVVIAADGQRSATRAQLHPDHRGLRYAGYTSWRAVTAAPVELGGVIGETWGRGERFGILPLRDGRVYWFAVANQPAGRRLPALPEVRRRFGRWHDPIPDLLEATAPDTVLSLDIHDLALPLPPFAVGRVALLGDAAHAMTPDVGQGAGQACKDAAVLAASLATAPDVRSGLLAYDAARRPRTQKIVAMARRTGRLAQTSLPLAAALRDGLLRLTPPGASLRMVENLTSWTAPVVPRRDT